MPPLLGSAIGACALAILLAVAALTVPGRTRVDRSRLDPTVRPAATGWSGFAVGAGRFTERVLRRLGRREALAAALDRAGVHRSPAQVASLSAVGIVAGHVLGVLLGGLLVGLVFACLTPVVVKVTLDVLARRRRAAFTDQLDDSLHLMASSLRAGYSVLRALDAVSRDTEAPTSEEFSRVVNEVRVGRDVNVALDEVAVRTASDDFAWVAQAIAIHREVGGNLAEVLDRVGATIRERNQLRRQARALSAEGRVSAAVLLLLPPVAGGLLALVSPEYMGRLTGTPTGLLMLVTAGLLMLVGGLWVRQVVKVRF
ncbi:MAG TPA: type II secretion system F family protein [Modestobacter sp.]|nr:type II secretion system F family protein [Modestobacter sp.]